MTTELEIPDIAPEVPFDPDKANTIVRISHGDIGMITCNLASYEDVYKDKGWELVPDDEPVVGTVQGDLFANGEQADDTKDAAAQAASPKK